MSFAFADASSETDAGTFASLKAGRHADRAGLASLLAAVAMYGPAVKRCLNTACRGKGSGLQTSPSRLHAISDAAEPVLWLRLHRSSPGGIL